MGKNWPARSRWLLAVREELAKRLTSGWQPRGQRGVLLTPRAPDAAASVVRRLNAAAESNCDSGGCRQCHAVKAAVEKAVATQAALKQMQEGGRIISIGSAAGERVAAPGLVPYAATKGAVKMFTQALAREIGSRGITVKNVQARPNRDGF